MRWNFIAWLLWWGVIFVMVVLVIWDHRDLNTSILRGGAGMILVLAMMMFRMGRQSMVRARCLRQQAEVAHRVLMEATSAYSFGEALVVTLYTFTPETMNKVMVDLNQHSDIKTIFPAGLPPWLNSGPTPP